MMDEITAVGSAAADTHLLIAQLVPLIPDSFRSPLPFSGIGRDSIKSIRVSFLDVE